MKVRRVLISGAGIAGPALATWLARLGISTTVVERARGLRPGGQAVDFRGEAHLSVLKRMGLFEQVRAHRTRMGKQTLIDEAGRHLVDLPSSFMSGDIEILRGDLSRVLYQATRDACEYVFGDSITSLVDDGEGVDVTFEHGAPRRFDMVVGADGLHSGVRELAFGPDHAFVRHHGYYVAGFTTPNFMGLDRTGLLLSEPGRGVSVTNSHGGDEARALLVFRSPERDYVRRSRDEQMKVITTRFSGMGWQVPSLIQGMWSSDDLYFDAISRIDIDRYSKGRVVLLGDAAYGGTLGGQGTGLSIVGAYVLAGEIARANGEVDLAAVRYESRMRGYATRCQKGAKHVGPFYAPRSRFELRMRNAMYGVLASPWMTRALEWLTTWAANDIELPSYAF